MSPRGIRLLVIEALKNKTDAGNRVYSPRDWPTTADMYPVILVQTPIDIKSSLGRNTSPVYHPITTVRFTGRLRALDDETEDNGAEKAEEALDQLRERVERAVINSYELTRVIQKFQRVRSTIDVDAGGEGHTVQLLMELDIE